MSNPQQQNYQSYLIRFQRSEEQERWRATLQDVRTSQVLHFATERELIHHLLTVLEGTSAHPTMDHSHPHNQTSGTKL